MLESLDIMAATTERSSSPEIKMYRNLEILSVPVPVRQFSFAKSRVLNCLTELIMSCYVLNAMNGNFGKESSVVSVGGESTSMYSRDALHHAMLQRGR